MGTLDPVDRERIVRCPLSGRIATVYDTDLELLGLCRLEFACLEDHARRACLALGYSLDHVGTFHKRLAELQSAGLFVRRNSLDAGLCQSVGHRPSPVTVIGIPTRDRAGSLTHALDSLAWANRTAGRDLEVVIADGSHDPASSAAVRATAASYYHSFGQVYYAGAADREWYAGELARAGADPTAARFALVPTTRFAFAAGANRNLLTLQAAGRVLLQLDDDTLSRTAPVPDSRPGITLTSVYDPTAFWFPDLSGPAADGLTHSADIAAVHESLLGRGVGDCVAAAGHAVDLRSADHPLIIRLRAPAARVRVTTAGVVGDSGMGASEYFLLLHGDSRTRLVGSPSAYASVLSGGAVLRGVPGPTITGGSVCMGLNLGLDLRTPLPPFPPVLRNEDGVFGEVVRVCLPAAFMGHLPAAVWHHPPDDRSHPPDALNRAADGPRADQLLIYFVRAYAPRTPFPDERRNLRILGEALAGLGGLPAEEFKEVVRAAAWEIAAGATARLSGLLEEFGAEPSWWARDVRRLLRRYAERVGEADYGTPTDLTAGVSPSEAMELFRGLVGSYGRLLQHWYDLVETALDLRARGVTPAKRLAPIGCAPC